MKDNNEKELNEIVGKLGFSDVKDFKKYMKARAKLNDYGAVCYSEKREGFELNYSNNCRSKFGIAATINGQFTDFRFN